MKTTKSIIARAKASKIKLRDLAKASGVHLATLYRWRDGRGATLEAVEKVQRALTRLEKRNAA